MRLVQNSLHQEVAATLREQIFTGAHAPGSFLDELQLCERMQISRTPLREALKVLTAEGLLRHEPRRGVGGQAVTGLVQRRLQICLQRRGFCLGGADVVQQRGVAGLCGLGGLLQQIELVLGRLPCLGALVEGGLCPLHVLLTRLGGL